jgi:hypothetical protein
MSVGSAMSLSALPGPYGSRCGSPRSGRFEISGPEIPRVSVEHIESAAQTRQPGKGRSKGAGRKG